MSLSSSFVDGLDLSILDANEIGRLPLAEGFVVKSEQDPLDGLVLEQQGQAAWTDHSALQVSPPTAPFDLLPMNPPVLLPPPPTTFQLPLGRCIFEHCLKPHYSMVDLQACIQSHCRPFACYVQGCTADFVSHLERIQHYVQFHAGCPIRCPYFPQCNVTIFGGMQPLEQHLQRHASQQESCHVCFSCHVCDYKTADGNLFEHHYSSQHPDVALESISIDQQVPEAALSPKLAQLRHMRALITGLMQSSLSDDDVEDDDEAGQQEQHYPMHGGGKRRLLTDGTMHCSSSLPPFGSSASSSASSSSLSTSSSSSKSRENREEPRYYTSCCVKLMARKKWVKKHADKCKKYQDECLNGSIPHRILEFNDEYKAMECKETQEACKNKSELIAFLNRLPVNQFPSKEERRQRRQVAKAHHHVTSNGSPGGATARAAVAGAAAATATATASPHTLPVTMPTKPTAISMFSFLPASDPHSGAVPFDTSAWEMPASLSFA